METIKNLLGKVDEAVATLNLPAEPMEGFEGEISPRPPHADVVEPTIAPTTPTPALADASTTTTPTTSFSILHPFSGTTSNVSSSPLTEAPAADPFANAQQTEMHPAPTTTESKGILGNITGFLSNITGIGSHTDASTTATEVKDEAVSKGNDLVDSAKQSASNAASSASNTAQDVKTSVSNAASSASNTVSNAASSASNTVSNAAQDAKTSASNAAESAKTTASNATSSASNTAQDAKTSASNAAQNAQTSASNAVQDAKTSASNAVQDAKTSVSNAASSAQTSASNAAQQVQNQTTPIIEQIKDSTSSAYNTVTQKAVQVEEDIKGRFNGMLQTTNDQASAASQTASDKASDASKAVSDKASEVSANVKQAASDAKTSVSNATSSASDSAPKKNEVSDNKSDRDSHPTTGSASQNASERGSQVDKSTADKEGKDAAAQKSNFNIKDQTFNNKDSGEIIDKGEARRENHYRSHYANSVGISNDSDTVGTGEHLLHSTKDIVAGNVPTSSTHGSEAYSQTAPSSANNTISKFGEPGDKKSFHSTEDFDILRDHPGMPVQAEVTHVDHIGQEMMNNMPAKQWTVPEHHETTRIPSQREATLVDFLHTPYQRVHEVLHHTFEEPFKNPDPSHLGIKEPNGDFPTTPSGPGSSSLLSQQPSGLQGKEAAPGSFSEAVRDEMGKSNLEKAGIEVEQAKGKSDQAAKADAKDNFDKSTVVDKSKAL